jgi:hypothetical protein
MKGIKWAEHEACMGEMGKLFKIFIGKMEGTRPLERPGRKREDNIRTDPREIRRKSVEARDYLTR